jgi:HSP20 family protein
MVHLTRHDPFAETGFDDIFRGLFVPVRTEKSPAAIRIDVTESANAYVVHAEIPGVAKDDIQVTIDGGQVTIGAEVKREAERKDGERLLRSERHFGRVERAFVLPVDIDEAASTATFEHGILELTLAKKAAQAGRRLTIQ